MGGAGTQSDTVYNGVRVTCRIKNSRGSEPRRRLLDGPQGVVYWRVVRFRLRRSQPCCGPGSSSKRGSESSVLGFTLPGAMPAFLIADRLMGTRGPSLAGPGPGFTLAGVMPAFLIADRLVGTRAKPGGPRSRIHPCGRDAGLLNRRPAYGNEGAKPGGPRSRIHPCGRDAGLLNRRPACGNEGQA